MYVCMYVYVFKYFCMYVREIQYYFESFIQVHQHHINDAWCFLAFTTFRMLFYHFIANFLFLIGNLVYAIHTLIIDYAHMVYVF